MKNKVVLEGIIWQIIVQASTNIKEYGQNLTIGSYIFNVTEKQEKEFEKTFLNELQILAEKEIDEYIKKTIKKNC